MVYEKISIHKSNLKTRQYLVKHDFPKDSKDILAFIKRRKLERNICERRQEKILSAFRSFLNTIKKDFEKIPRNDLENFKLSKKYSKTTLRDYIEIIKDFYEFKYPDKFKRWELDKWFTVPRTKTTPEILKEEEVEKLFNACKVDEDRFIIAVLFDSGARAEEFLNIRFEDIIKPTQSFPYYKLDLKEEYSKTEGRTIGLYWKHTSKAIRDYLESIKEQKPNAQVITRSYDSIRLFLTRLGKRVLNKRIHFHIFRKSSATHYANLDLGREKLCIRYGWKFVSNMVDIYIKRAGIKEEEIKERILNKDLGHLEKENKELETKFTLLNENSKSEIESLKKIVEALQVQMTTNAIAEGIRK